MSLALLLYLIDPNSSRIISEMIRWFGSGGHLSETETF